MMPEVTHGALVPLETLAKEINACHDKAEGYDRKAADFRATRDQKILEAHGRIKEGEIHQSFSDWCQENLTISRNQVHKVIRRLESPKVHVTNGNPDYQNDAVETEVEVWPKSQKNRVNEIFNTIVNTLTVDQMIELTKLLISECNEAKLRRAQGVTLESVGNLMEHVDATAY